MVRRLMAALLLVPALSVAATPSITADVALKIINGCVAYAKGKGQSHAIAVYDGSGHPVALLRMDGNQPGVTEFAVQKAEAVASWHFSTADMAASAKQTPGFASAPHVVTVAGGIPVYSPEGEYIGAVGVSGEAPEDDTACGEAGVQGAGLSVSREPKG